MKSRSFAAFIAISAVVVLTILASTAQDASTQADGTAATTQKNPVPLINQPLVPDAVRPGGSGFTLTVNGTGFVSGSALKWNGSARATTFVSASKLTANIAASDIAAAKTASVTVVNPSPGGGTSNVAFFQVTPSSSLIGFRSLNVGVGDQPASVALGDFNRDGKLDVAVANSSGNSVSVLLGNGDGTFKLAVNYGAGSNPDSVAVGDFNGDGKLDLVVANLNSDNISVLLGNGDGTFQPATDYSAGSGPTSVAVGDFNGDGKLDVVVSDDATNGGISGVSVLLGNGDGTFQPGVNYAAGSYPLSVAVGDFNRDSKLDLVVANEGTNNVSVLLGNGDGTFQPAVDYPAGPNSLSVAVGDFNGDGKLDLAVANFGGGISGNVSVLLGNGNGTFQPAVSYPVSSGPSSGPSSVAVMDFNGDEKLDLVVADAIAGGVGVLLGNGDGTFQADLDYGTGPYPNSVAVGDFNRDGKLDLVVADYMSTTVSVLLRAPILSLSKTNLSFALQLVGTSSPSQTVTLTNIDKQVIGISSIAITGANSSDFSHTSTCGSSLAPGAECTINTSFTPTTVGPRVASVTITDSAAGSPQSIALQGVGIVTGPDATLSTTSQSISCGQRCSFNHCGPCVCSFNPPEPITLSDFGKTNLTITGITATLPFIQQNTCDGSLKSGETCTILVGLGPHTSGTGRLQIKDNASGSPQVVNLTGRNSCR